MKKMVVIGSGFSGLSAACFLAKAGFRVTVLEKLDMPGGRARKWESDGFLFDMGPSWYWMPDVFERFFEKFNHKPHQFYSLRRLDPSYKIFYPNDSIDIPANFGELRRLFESLEPGSGAALEKFLEEALFKYRVGMQKLVHKPGLSVLELLDTEVIAGVFKLDVFTSMKKHVAKHFRNPRLQQIMEFPILFLGAKAQNTPALYSLMNYADIRLGTWYPRGGMFEIVRGMHALAVSLGVEFAFETEVSAFEIEKGRVTGVRTNKGDFKADGVLAAADYHHVDQQLLPQKYRNYSADYWNRRVLAPSCMLYYIGLNKRVAALEHHNLFFDASFEAHATEIYETHEWPKNPLFYVCCTSKSDDTAPPGCENLFILIPVSTEVEDTPEIRQMYFDRVMDRLEKHCGENIRDAVVCHRSYARSNFIRDYHSFKGNAYGLANTLLQTANLKPSIKNKHLKNLYFTGQLTVPGPGVPPALISGEVVAGQMIKDLL